MVSVTTFSPAWRRPPGPKSPHHHPPLPPRQRLRVSWGSAHNRPESARWERNPSQADL